MIVDLASSGFEHLTLNISFEASPDAVRQLWEAAGFKPDQPDSDEIHYVEAATFRKNNHPYQVLTLLFLNEGNSFRLAINYTSDENQTSQTSRILRPNLRKMDKFLDSLAMPCSVACLSVGDIPSNRFKPIFGLPLLKFNMPHGFFDEIRGVRLVKLHGGVENESVALDLVEDDKLRVFAQTTYTTTLNSSVSRGALTRLASLKSHAVIEIQPDVSEGA